MTEQEKFELAEGLYNKVRFMSSTEARETAITLEQIFPELVESEDEKIRKHLIKFIEGWKEKAKDFTSRPAMWTSDEEDIDKILAWLEKQKPTEWSEEDEKILKELVEEVKDQLDSVPSPDCMDKEDEKVLKQLNRWMDWLKSLKPQSHWKPSEEEIEELQRIMKEYGFNDNKCLKQLLDELKTLHDYN